MSLPELALEIARINIFDSHTKVHVELVHAVLDEEGGARHVVPDLQKAYAAWQRSGEMSLPQLVADYITDVHPEAFNPPSEVKTCAGIWSAPSFHWPHWVYNVYVVGQKRTWEVEIDRSKSSVRGDFYRVGTRRELSKWNKRAVMFLEGRVTRLLFDIRNK